MKKNNLKKGLFTALLLVSSVVTAGTKYPAADFQPKVVYQDSDYKHSESSAGATASFGEKAKDDSNFPAATFKPEVLFHDADYKHNTKVSNVENSTSESSSDSVSSDSSEESSSAESVSPILALVILAVAVFLFRKKSGSKAEVDTSGELTGVAKYLQSKAPKISGVAKYLETHQPTPKSGVARYVAKRVVEVKRAAAGKTTGVEKYMRKKG